MGNWRDHEQQRRDAMNESAFRRCEEKYLDPPEDDPDDIEIEDSDDPEDFEEERQSRKFDREREEAR